MRVSKILLLLALFTFSLPASGQTQHIPFVGCPMDTRENSLPAPAQAQDDPTLPDSVAKNLAYYRAVYGWGMVAPSGWYCYGYAGDLTFTFLLSPYPITGKDREGDIKLHGPGIELEYYNNDNMKIAVAIVAARLFPAHRAFVERVIKENALPARDYTFGPYPADHLIRRSADDVIYITPPGKQGMGTQGNMAPSNAAITGEAVIGDGGVMLINIRLPARQKFLTTTILDANRFKSSDLPPD